MSILDTLRNLLPLGKPAEQVGAPTSPGAVEPAAHLGQQPPAVMDQIEWTGDDYDTVARRVAPPRASRTWRTPISGEPATNDTVSLSTSAHGAADAHLSPGQPDTRRAESDKAAGPDPDDAPFAEHTRNVRQAVVIDPEAAPARTRGGFTGEDPTRAARQQVAFTVRPFDKLIADHPGSVVKGGQPNPLAARPPERKRLIGGRPSPAGSGGTYMLPVGPQPNTVRSVPKPWDTKIVNPNKEAETTTGRAAGWRAR